MKLSVKQVSSGEAGRGWNQEVHQLGSWPEYYWQNATWISCSDVGTNPFVGRPRWPVLFACRALASLSLSIPFRGLLLPSSIFSPRVYCSGGRTMGEWIVLNSPYPTFTSQSLPLYVAHTCENGFSQETPDQSNKAQSNTSHQGKYSEIDKPSERLHVAEY